MRQAASRDALVEELRGRGQPGGASSGGGRWRGAWGVISFASSRLSRKPGVVPSISGGRCGRGARRAGWRPPLVTTLGPSPAADTEGGGESGAGGRVYAG
jgi:hypothetical protein